MAEIAVVPDDEGYDPGQLCHPDYSTRQVRTFPVCVSRFSLDLQQIASLDLSPLPADRSCFDVHKALQPDQVPNSTVQLIPV